MEIRSRFRQLNTHKKIDSLFNDRLVPSLRLINEESLSSDSDSGMNEVVWAEDLFANSLLLASIISQKTQKEGSRRPSSKIY